MVDIIAGAGDTGLIHADLHLGNALFHGGEVKLIDFDDCGSGPRLYDLARRPVGPAGSPGLHGVPGRAAVGLPSAARHRRKVPLDDFIALRQVAFDLWFTGTAQVNTAFSARLDEVHRWSLAMLDIVEAPSS